jgi:hypothetical protein
MTGYETTSAVGCINAASASASATAASNYASSQRQKTSFMKVS